MKKKEKANINGMTAAELATAVTEVNEKLVKIYLDRASKPIRNTREGRNLKKRKAVILTVLKEKETHG